MAVIEEILAAAARSAGQVPTRDGKAVVDRAAWFCTCITDFGTDAPTWVIYDIVDGGLGWCRVPDRLDVSDLVVARVVDGDHVHPEQVLHWLQGTNGNPWSVRAGAAGTVLGDLARRIRDLQAD
ncbi:hypothetical protein ACOACQ_23040 [Nocardioides sp. CPCC 206347]|uniref:hypothetical protein n=1 Tax=unclassified Nocardioides TaxID=2615069 RepID=UPI003608264A